MDALTKAQKKWKLAAIHTTAAIARQYDRFWSVTVAASLLLMVLASMTGQLT